MPQQQETQITPFLYTCYASHLLPLNLCRSRTHYEADPLTGNDRYTYNDKKL